MDDIKSKLDMIAIPEGLDDVIKKSIQRARKRKKVYFLRNISIFIASFLILFIASINLSRSFAIALAKVPFLKPLIEIASFDKGLKLTVEKGYAIQINKSNDGNGIKFTVDSITFDNRRLVIFYNIKSEKAFRYINLKDMEFYNEYGNRIEDCFISSHIDYDEKETNIKQGTIDIHFFEGAKVPQKLTVEIKQIELGLNDPNEKEIIGGTWKIDVDLNNLNLSAKLLKIDKKIEIGDINVLLKSIKIYPTTCELEVKFEGEKYKAFSLVKPVLIDGKGSIYNSNMSTYKEGCENEVTYIFESPYFSNINGLKLKFEGIFFVPNSKQFLIIDIKNKKIIDDAGYKIQLVDVKRDVVPYEMKSNLKIEYIILDEEIVGIYNKLKIMNGLQLKNPIDEKGREYSIVGTGITSEREQILQEIYVSNISQDTSILNFEIVGAPKGIIKPIEVRITE